ncbi:MAG: sulfatase-like hydrolase/transferase [Luteolibacter sp.]
MKFFKLAPLVLAAFTCALPAQTQPNVIFVLVDDMGWGDLGVFYQNSRGSDPKFLTPNLDAIAAEGMQLRRHYCPAPVCAPSRASLLLGVHQGHANVRDNQFDKGLENNHTLGTVMKQAGYATAAIGKWGLGGGPSPAPARAETRGFDYFFGYLKHGDAHRHYPKENAISIYDGTTDIGDDLDKCYSTDLIAARAKKWIVDQRTASTTTPFFMYLAFTAPHARLDVPTQAYPAGKGLTGGLQWLGAPGAMINTASGTIDTFIHPDYASEGSWPDYAKRYATMVRRIDDAMADLVQTLKDLSIDENTMIVFTSDNGPANESGNGGSYTYNPTFFDSFGPMDGLKRDTWEGGMREPALVRWPGHISPGSISSSASQFQDWLPTLAEIAGLSAPARTDGVSLLPTLTGSGIQRDSTIYVEYYYNGSTPSYSEYEASRRGSTRNQEQVIHLDGYKGIRYDVTAATDDFQIYETLTDPKETTNLAGTSAYFITLQQRMKDRVLQVRRPGGGVSRPYDSENIPAIATLGTAPGLDYRGFEGSYPWVPDFTPLTSAVNGSSNGIDLGVRSRDSEIGLEYKGYLNVPTAGTYTLYLSTDSRAFLRLHDANIIDADYGYTGGTEVSATVNLSAGKHPLRLGYIRGTGGTPQLTLKWSGPGIAKEEIPTANLLRFSDAPTPPSANADSATTPAGSGVSIPVLANDTDDGAPAALSISAVSKPKGGNALVTGTTITYTPSSGVFGEDSFTYTITDGQDTATATVTVNVTRPFGSALWIPFDEASGSTAHESGGAPIGTLNGFVGTPWTAGKLGNALSFDGIDDRVILDGQKGVTGTAARTVTFWINAAASQTTGNRPTLVSWGNGNSTNSSNTGTRFDINLNHSSGYRLRGEFNSSGVNFNTASLSDLRGAGWVHCAIVVPAGATVSQLRGYLNGELATAGFEPSTSGSVAINTASQNDISVGSISDGAASRAFAGMLDDVRLYPAELSVAEIQALVAQTSHENFRSQWHYLYAGNASPIASNWTADADADGFSAALEFALGGNPTIPALSIAPVFSLDDSTFRFNRRQEGISAAAYLPQVSETLMDASWSTFGTPSVVPHPDMAGFDRVTVTLPASDAPKRFVRLKVEGF